MSLPTPTEAGHKLFTNDLRRLIFPIGMSVVLHAVVFWSANDVSLSPDASAARGNKLDASLHRTPSADPVEKPVFIPAPSPEAAPKRQPEKPLASAPVTPPTPNVAAEGPREQDQVEAQTKLPIEPIRTGVDLAGLRQYHLALGRKAQQFRRYPEEARAAGWRGRVAMRLVVSETGAPLSVSLLGSSGFPVLDRAALEMMLLAASHTEVPESLRGRIFNIDLAIDYAPEDSP